MTLVEEVTIPSKNITHNGNASVQLESMRTAQLAKETLEYCLVPQIFAWFILCEEPAEFSAAVVMC